MRWIFRERSPAEVETEVTQRDQFRNDDVDLSDTVVREAVQNSLDAQANGQQVRVTFTLVESIPATVAEHLFKDQIDHARAAELLTEEIDYSQCSALVVEDFGTKGLTGRVDERDDDNFSDFWRRHGKSHKTGKAGGRWGLGKLVYSYSSKLSAFFGLTYREGDVGPYLMGQTVLNTRNLNGRTYVPHGFFADEITEGPNTGLQIPINSGPLIDVFQRSFELRRNHTPGLSIVIPYPREEIDLEKMIRVGVENYFFPILTEQLVLQFGDVVIDRASLRQVALRYVADRMDHARMVFDFVEAAHELPEEALHRLTTAWYTDWKLADNDFGDAELEQLRERFKEGEMIGLRLPMVIKKKNNTEGKSYFDLYLQSAPDVRRGVDLYVRGGITVPGEAKFKHRKALGALVARDDAVSEFLGDAENAAHTRWNGRAEKLQNKYKYPSQTLRAVRNALVEFLDVLLHAVEEEAEDALLQFFWEPLAKGKAPRRKRKKSPPKPGPLPRRPQPIVVSESRGGFTLRPGTGIAELELPLTCRIQIAYDTLQGNPFKGYSEYDFDVGKRSQIQIDAEGCVLQGSERNSIEVQIDRPDFALRVSGFDDDRDLVTRVSVAEASA